MSAAMESRGKKRKKGSKSRRSRPAAATPLDSSWDESYKETYDDDAFNAKRGRHYDTEKEGGKRKRQAKDLWSEQELKGGENSWGMMMGTIEVVDASQYTVTRGVESSDAARGGDGSDDEGSDDFDGCDISDEECDILVLDVGEKNKKKKEKKEKKEKKKNNDDEDEDEEEDGGDVGGTEDVQKRGKRDKNHGGLESFQETNVLDEGEWGSAAEEEGASASQGESDSDSDSDSEDGRAGVNRPNARDEKRPDNERVAAAPLTPLQKKRQALSTINGLLLSHSATTSLTNCWMANCGGVHLHPLIAYNFTRLKYASPLPIQASTLPASLLGRRNILGCAPTGSGKTLCYGVSILQGILSRLDEGNPVSNAVKAIIMVPTRELAVQVSSELGSYVAPPAKKVLQNLTAGSRKKRKDKARPIIETDKVARIGVIVGGLSQEKQTRVLKNRPEIIVATPGRLWELVSLFIYFLLFFSPRYCYIPANACIDETSIAFSCMHAMQAQRWTALPVG